MRERRLESPQVLQVHPTECWPKVDAEKVVAMIPRRYIKEGRSAKLSCIVAADRKLTQ
jgi:hypothetical protein